MIVRSFGGPEVLEVAEVPVPEPKPGQIRIRVAAAAVNPVDIQTRSGALTAGGLLPDREVIGIGWDVAGTVDALGPEVAGFRPGESVIGLSDRLALPLKTQAKYVVLDADAVAAVPPGTDLVAAAPLPLGGLTAVQALDVAAVKPGDSLLVTGAAGSVGGYTVQLAVLAGARLVAVAGADDEEMVRDLGAEFFVPRNADLPAAVRDLVPGGVHAAVDAASVGMLALEAVRSGGALVSVLGNAPTPLRGIRVGNVWIRADGPDSPSWLPPGCVCGSPMSYRWTRSPRRTAGWRRVGCAAVWCWCPDPRRRTVESAAEVNPAQNIPSPPLHSPRSRRAA